MGSEVGGEGWEVGGVGWEVEEEGGRWEVQEVGGGRGGIGEWCCAVLIFFSARCKKQH